MDYRQSIASDGRTVADRSETTNLEHAKTFLWTLPFNPLAAQSKAALEDERSWMRLVKVQAIAQPSGGPGILITSAIFWPAS